MTFLKTLLKKKQVDQWRREIPEVILETLYVDSSSHNSSKTTSNSNINENIKPVKFPFLLVSSKTDKGNSVISSQDLVEVTFLSFFLKQRICYLV